LDRLLDFTVFALSDVQCTTLYLQRHERQDVIVVCW